jgi:hypothetical protein
MKKQIILINEDNDNIELSVNEELQKIAFSVRGTIIYLSNSEVSALVEELGYLQDSI